MEEMYTNADFQKISYKAYQDCDKVKKLLVWEDFLGESILRFVDKALTGKAIRNCKSYYYGICYNYCRELVRQSRKTSQPKEGKEISTDALFEAVKPYVFQLRPQCRFLLSLLYFFHPPLPPAAYEEIARALKEEGYRTQAGSVPSTVALCKRELRKLIGDKLDDIL